MTCTETHAKAHRGKHRNEADGLRRGNDQAAEQELKDLKDKVEALEKDRDASNPTEEKE